jgi:hypothetical protein
MQDNAALAMIERSADAWEHNQFKDVIVRAANVEMYIILAISLGIQILMFSLDTTKL